MGLEVPIYYIYSYEHRDRGLQYYYYGDRGALKLGVYDTGTTVHFPTLLSSSPSGSIAQILVAEFRVWPWYQL